MLDNSYEIVGRIVVKDAAQPGAESVKKRLKEVEDRAGLVGNNITNMLGGAFRRVAALGAGLFMGGALATAGRELIGINSGLEQANVGMASLFNAQAGVPMAASLQLARREVAGLREDARKGVGELSDYTSAYQGALGLALPLGASLSQVRTLTRTGLAAGFAMQGDRGLQNAPLDIQQALAGQVGDRTTPIVMAALRAAGITEGAYRKLDPSKRIDTLITAFGRFEPGVEMMGRTWSAQMSTLKDNVRELLGRVSQPLFDRWSESLRGVNKWIERNYTTLEGFATRWGRSMLSVWNTMVGNARTYLGLVSAAALVSVASPALGAARGAMGSLGPAGASGAALAPVLSSLAVPLGAVAVAGLAVYAALRTWPGLFDDLSKRADRLVSSLAGIPAAFDALTSAGSALAGVGWVVVEGVGVWLDYLSVITGSITVMVATLGLASQMMGAYLEGFKVMFEKRSFSAGVKRTDELLDAANARWVETLKGAAKNTQMGAAIFGEDPYLSAYGTKHGAEVRSTSPGVTAQKPPNNFYGPITFQLTTEINEDPVRVMVAFEEGADRLSRFKRSTSGNFGDL